jgi:hypothetical protein
MAKSQSSKVLKSLEVMTKHKWWQPIVKTLIERVNLLEWNICLYGMAMGRVSNFYHIWY